MCVCTQDPEIVKRVVDILKLHRRGDIPNISKHTKFKVKTLYEWSDRLKKDPNYSPLSQQYGKHRRIFTDEEEDNITDYIITQILLKGILFTDQDFEDLIMCAFIEKFKDEEDYKKIPQFVCSKGFIYNFKKKHRLSSKRCHAKRRPDNKQYDKEFCYEMHKLFEEIPLYYICNVDETALTTIPSFLQSWHMVGHDHVVRYIQANEKERITVVVGITADGNKLPLQFITKGKTEVAIDNHIGDVPGHMRACNENGWSTEDTFCSYLTGVREFYGFEDPNTIHMILDVFRVHISDKVKNTAKELNIQLHVIPAGMTDELQPLDVKIFGPLKAFIRHLFQKRLRDTIDGVIKQSDVCKDFIRAWERMHPDQIEGSFEHLKTLETWYTDNDGNRVILAHHHREYCCMNLIERRQYDVEHGYKS